MNDGEERSYAEFRLSLLKQEIARLVERKGDGYPEVRHLRRVEASLKELLEELDERNHGR